VEDGWNYEWQDDTDREKLNIHGENPCPTAALSTANPIYNRPGIAQLYTSTGLLTYLLT
jgi:hypothetical protein